MNTKRKMLTTTDNPYNPFTQFDQWYDYDLLAQHNSCGMLAIFAKTCDEFTEEQNNEIINEAIEEICELNPIYVGVSEDSLVLKRLKPA